MSRADGQSQRFRDAYNQAMNSYLDVEAEVDDGQEDEEMSEDAQRELSEY